MAENPKNGPINPNEPPKLTEKDIAELKKASKEGATEGISDFYKKQSTEKDLKEKHETLIEELKQKEKDSALEALKEAAGQSSSTSPGSPPPPSDSSNSNMMILLMREMVTNQKETMSLQSSATTSLKELELIRKSNEDMLSGAFTKREKAKKGGIGGLLKGGLESAAQVSGPFAILNALIKTGGGIASTLKGEGKLAQTMSGFKPSEIMSRRRTKKIEKTRRELGREKATLSGIAEEIQTLNEKPELTEKEQRRKEQLIQKAKQKQEILGSKSEKFSGLMSKEFSFQKGKSDKRYGLKKISSEDRKFQEEQAKKKTSSSIMKDVIGKDSKIDKILRGEKSEPKQESENNILASIIAGGEKKSGIISSLIGGKAEKPVGELPTTVDLLNSKISFSRGSTPTTFGQFTAGTFFKLEDIESKLGGGLGGGVPPVEKKSSSGGFFSKLLGATSAISILGKAIGAVLPVLVPALTVAAGAFAAIQVYRATNAAAETTAEIIKQKIKKSKVEKDTRSILEKRYGLSPKEAKEFQKNPEKHALYGDKIREAAKKRNETTGILPKKSEVDIKTSKTISEVQLSQSASKTVVPLQTDKKIFENDAKNQETFAKMIASELAAILKPVLDPDMIDYREEKKATRMADATVSAFNLG